MRSINVDISAMFEMVGSARLRHENAIDRNGPGRKKTLTYRRSVRVQLCIREFSRLAAGPDALISPKQNHALFYPDQCIKAGICTLQAAW